MAWCRWGVILACMIATAGARDPTAVDREATELLDDGRFLEAMAAFDELTAEAHPAPWRAKGYARMGGIMALFLGQNADAERALQKAIGLDPKGPIGADAHFQLAMILHEQERYREAADQFEAFLAIDAGSMNGPTAEFLLGQCRRLANVAVSVSEPALVPTDVFHLRDGTIRVAVVRNADQVILGCTGPWAATVSRRDIRDLHPGPLTLNAKDTEVIGLREPVSTSPVFSPTGADMVTVNGVRFSGVLRVLAAKGKLTVVNIVDMEDYLRGVVPREMPASWPAKALEAQAVCARTYAVYHKVRRRDHDFDLLATVASQVYGGVDGQDARSDSAVTRTRGRILLYEGEPALTLFHSSSGGHTEDMEKVWGSGVPYLVAQEDRHSPASAWKLSLSKDDIARALSSCGEDIKGLRTVEFVDKDASGRYQRVKIVRTDGAVFLKSDRFRGCVGAGAMKSTRLGMTTKGDTFVLEGTGFGHGVGLSQWGARDMAAHGIDASAILAFYYPGSVLGRLEIAGG
ncbi:SpoIID/LytB domain-containing protein [Candidatus Fermentibacteria bacterium]|nr:SpoIID/LytB domain-containing protein [Candidatus Fermentibacteria bacterium]